MTNCAFFKNVLEKCRFFDIFIVKNVEKVPFFEYIFEKCTIGHDIVDHMHLTTSKTRLDSFQKVTKITIYNLVVADPNSILKSNFDPFL